MKKIIIAMLFSLTCVCGHAQTWDEWTKQRKTQIKYLLKQIAGLQTYIGYVQKGYQVVDKGLGMIGDIKDGDFKLHQFFIDALSLVKPLIRDKAKLPEMIALQIKMITMYQRSVKRIKGSGQLTQKELDHIIKVSFRLLDASTDNLMELVKLVTDDSYVMKDDERIRRIDGLHKQMYDQYSMMRSFCNENTVLVMQRMQEQNEVDVMRKLYQVK